MRTRGIRAFLLAAGLLAAWAAPASAQAIGSVFGIVTDSSGAVMPGVTVTITGTGLQQPLVGVTSENGSYQFPSVPVGPYTVMFELASFKKAVRSNVVLPAGFNAADQKPRSVRCRKKSHLHRLAGGRHEDPRRTFRGIPKRFRPRATCSES